MTKPSLKLLFLRKYRTSKKYYRKLQLPPAVSGATLSFGGFSSRRPTGNGPVTGVTYTAPSARRPDTRFEPIDTVDCCVLLYDCFSLCRLRTFLIIVAAGIVSTTTLIFFHNQRLLQYRLTSRDYLRTGSEDSDALAKINYMQNVTPNFDEILPYLNSVYREDLFSPQHGIRLRRCTIPDLKPFATEVQKFIQYAPKPNCAREQSNAFDGEVPYSIRNGSYLVRNPKVNMNQTKGCCYRPFQRSGENSFRTLNFCTEITTDITHVPDEIEYIELLCINNGLHTDFRDGFALTPRKEHVESRIETFEASQETPKDEDRLSVLILGLDATSRMNFIRALPKSNQYLLKNLSAISLNGYTKVAENTLPNVVPLLTGLTLEEFTKKCVDESKRAGQVHLDNCPFIWNMFAENGYRTLLAEDDVNIGIFNMNWGNAFYKTPTDYYMRPYSYLMQKKHGSKNGYCYGSSLSFDKILDFIRSLVETFKTERYFQFIWSTKLSHDNFNNLRWGDESLLKLLQYFEKGHYLNNTALLVLGDHGSRLDQIRSTKQGQLEDRMPVAYLAVPRWFRNKYHRAYRSMRKNGNRITSAFDMHKTFYDFINPARLLAPSYGLSHASNGSEIVELPNSKQVNLDLYPGKSLFTEIPENRTCFAAGIPLHWCVCHRKIPIEKGSELAQSAAQFIVESLNYLLKETKGCAKLYLKSVDDVFKWDSSEIIRESCYTENASSNLSNSTNSTNPSCQNQEEVIIVQVSFTTSPSDATFETTVIQLKDGYWRITENVVRTNAYEGQSSCVEQKYKPYCYCNDDDTGGFYKK